MSTIKNAAISAKILANVQSDMSVQQAFDAVMGEGSYAKLAGEIYDELRARA